MTRSYLGVEWCSTGSISDGARLNTEGGGLRYGCHSNPVRRLRLVFVCSRRGLKRVLDESGTPNGPCRHPFYSGNQIKGDLRRQVAVGSSEYPSAVVARLSPGDKYHRHWSLLRYWGYCIRRGSWRPSKPMRRCGQHRPGKFIRWGRHARNKGPGSRTAGRFIENSPVVGMMAESRRPLI